MNTVLQSLDFCYYYIGDVLEAFRNINEHIQQLATDFWTRVFGVLKVVEFL